MTKLMLTSHQFQTHQVQRSTTLRVEVSTSNPTKAKHIDPTFHGYSATSHDNHQTAYNILYSNQRSRSSKTAAAVNEEVAHLQSETRSLEDILSELSSAITSLLFIGITSTSTSLLFQKFHEMGPF
uniref:Uncharacterized protein n=1 Tax=Hucho hucho TaxID=62062 RepID=A0A4W5JEP1_9TELE